MKRLCWLTIAITVLFSSPAAHSQISEFSKWKTNDLYRHGTSLLKKGHNLLTAIDALREATKKDPQNAEYQTALACALASRFQSVSMAVEQQTEYARLLRDHFRKTKEWDEAQLDKTNKFFGVPEPVAPLKPATVDDDKPFVLSPEESARVRRILGIASIAAYKAAEELAGTKSIIERAETSYSKGWGLFVLRVAGKDILFEKSASTVEDQHESFQFAISEEDVKNAFKTCIQLVPDKADYWYSLGLATVPKYADLDGNLGQYLFEGGQLHSDVAIQEASSCFKQAINYKKNHFESLYILSIVFSQKEPDTSIVYMLRAGSLRPASALLKYELACFQLSRLSGTHSTESLNYFRSALDNIEAGNQLQLADEIQLSNPCPSVLRSAVQFLGMHGLGVTVLLNQILKGFSNAKKFLWCTEDSGEYFRMYSAGVGFAWNGTQFVTMNSRDIRQPRLQMMLRYCESLFPVFYISFYRDIEVSYTKFPSPEKRLFLEKYHDNYIRLKYLDDHTQY